MQSKLVSAVALLAGLLAFATCEPVTARGFGYPSEVGPEAAGWAPRHRTLRRHARMLPPDVRYRNPRIAPIAPPRGPDFLIHAYLPRYTDVPMYNEPPARFPSR